MRVDNSIVRQALTPLAATQHSCVVWLGEYFETMGDSLPDQDRVDVVAALNRDMYVRYCNDRKASNLNFVSESKFNELWRVLFPKHVKRPHTDIAGSCDTCYQIDRLRQLCTTSYERKMLHHAHFIHRGGMFMPERKE